MKKSTKGAITFVISLCAYMIFKLNIIGICTLINLICECVFVYLDYFGKDNK